MHRLLVAAAVVIVATTVAAPARAQTGEVIRSYDVAIVVERDGAILVTETIAYDFGGSARHGIFRDIPVRFRYDDRYDRVYPLDVRSVSAEPPGTPAEYKREDEGRTVRIRVGDPDRTISGLRTYTLVYRVRGVLNGFPDHDELFWNAIGDQWDVPIERATARVEAPADVTQAACYAGPGGSRLACTEARRDGRAASFSQTSLARREALTVVVGLPRGAVPAPRPVLDERWSAARAFELTALTGTVSGLLLLAVVGLIVRLLWVGGRDRRFMGSPVDAVFGTVGGHDEAVPLLERTETPVEFVPPDGIRPGQVGTLFDEIANPLDVTATVVDLAVRGYLRIDELPGEGWRRRPDWSLVRLAKTDGDLKTYERALLDGLFEDGDEVKLSSLKTRFAARLRRVQSALYDDVVSAGWFARRPDRVRAVWRGIGVAVLVVGAGLTALAAAFTHLGLVPVPLVIGGLLLVVTAGRMPRRTAKGTGMLRRVQGFRRLIENGEAERARFAERAGIFSEYLPYAIVFGATEKWARAFSGLDQEVARTGWYTSPHPFTVVAFADSLDDFAVTTSGTIVASTPSSSGSSGFGGGGFSGGGGGGGGGGSW